jgi:homoserine dehydrogenase
MKPINVGLLGIGTVGGGTFTVLKRNEEEITRRAGRPIRITTVADKNLELARERAGEGVKLTDDAFSVVTDPEIDIVVELIGGYGVAKELVLKAIENGKHVVTANKALLAVHGNEIFAAAQKKGVMVAFEAAVAGGIPIIKALREGLSANRIQWLAGIINGTTNFILSEMRDKGLPFAEVLKEAQRLGYAEADPTFDIEGVAAHKATLMAHRLRRAGAVRQGLRRRHHQARSRRHQVRRAAGLPHQAAGHRPPPRAGHRAARAPHPDPGQAPDRQRRRRDERRAGAGRRRRRHPVLRQGRRRRADRQRRDRRPGRRHPPAHRRPRAPRAAPGLPARPDLRAAGAAHRRSRDQLLPAPARGRQAGVLADVTRILADQSISIDAMLQREPEEGEAQTDIIILTHLTIEKNMNAAIAKIESLDAVTGKVVRLRLENL